MEKADRELLESLMVSDYKLRRLYEEHLTLEDELKKFHSSRARTFNELMQEKRLKKQKLRGMDTIMEILNEYRQAA